MAKFYLTPAAEKDLEEIWTFTCQQWSKEQADRYIDRLVQAFTDLAYAPKTAPACDHIRPGYRRRNVERHIIYFRITPDGIAIVRLLHERMNAPQHLV
jgi:toxin ParE1/3/4